MPIFVLIIQKLSLLYLLVLAGFVAGRRLGTRKEVIAPLLIYMLTPTVIFLGIARARLELQYLLLPAMTYLLSSAMCFFALWSGRCCFKRPLTNLLGYLCGSLNSGYLGIPVGIALFGPDSLSLLVLCILGTNLFENTLGFYVTARGHHSVAESLRRLVRLPNVYAFVLGLIWNLCGFELSGDLLEFGNNVRGAYSVLGMMLIGLALADLHEFRFDHRLNFYVFFTKFLVWPALAAGLLWLDGVSFGIFGTESQRIIFFMATLPPAANTVAFATELKTEPEKAALVVLIMTLLALVMIPALNLLFV